MIRSLIFSKSPVYCVFCQERDASLRNLCPECALLLDRPFRRCLCCALPMVGNTDAFPEARQTTSSRVTDWSFSSSKSIGTRSSSECSRGWMCGQCVQSRPPLERTVCAMNYRWPATQLIHQLKFGRKLVLARALGSMLGTSTTMPDRASRDLVLAMPLSQRRLSERGFNQSYEIARFAAKQAGIPLGGQLLTRVSDRPAQATLDRSARQQNVNHVFHATKAVQGLHLVLVDDVMTTGATLFAAANTLKDAGALSVHAWVVARTEKP